MEQLSIFFVSIVQWTMSGWLDLMFTLCSISLTYATRMVSFSFFLVRRQVRKVFNLSIRLQEPADILSKT